MNQPQAQGPCLSTNQVSGPTPASSQLPNTFLSSSEYNNLSYNDHSAPHNLNFQEMNIITQNFLQRCDQNIQFDSLDELFSHGNVSNLRDPDGRTLLMVATENGFFELIQKCLDSNIQIDMKDKSGKTALCYAVEAEPPHASIVSFLLDRGADPNNKWKHGVTPLLKAIEKARFKITELLLKRGGNCYAKYENTGDTALHLAAKKGDKKIVKLLLENRCDPNRKNKKKQTVWDVCKENQDITEILRNFEFNNRSKEEVFPNIRRVNSEAVYYSGPYKGNNLQGEGEGETEFHITNLAEPPSLGLSHVNRNDDNFSNASTTCSNAHSEYRFNLKHGAQSLNPTNNPSDEAIRQPDRNLQQSNPKSIHNRKREDSGVSRNSLTSVHSDMASDNESMSGQSQNNVTSDYSSVYFSPELHEKTRSTGSIGSAEPAMHGYMANTLNKHNSYPYPFAQHNSEYNGNYYNQKRKYSKNNFQQGMKNPYHNQNSFEPNSNHFRREESGYASQGELMNQNYHYNNNFNQPKRDQHEYMLQPHRSYPPLPQDGQIGYQNYQNNMAGFRGPQNFIANNNPMNHNAMMQQSFNGAFIPVEMNNAPNLNITMHNQYFYKSQQFPHQQVPQDPLTQMFNKMHNGHSQYVSSPVNTLVPQSHYYNQQTPPRRNMSDSNHTQKENAQQNDYLRSFVKDAREGQIELENEKLENVEVKALLEATILTCQGLEEELKEKDEIEQALMKKIQDLEKLIKEKDPNFILKVGQSQAFSTNSLLADFRTSTIDDIINKPYPRLKRIDEVLPILHEEILSFERYIDAYYSENKDVINALLAIVQETLLEISPEAECNIYGSFATGLCLPDSDIDIVVKLPQTEYACEVLRQFESRIQESEWMGSFKTIQNKTVPLLKITCSDAYLNKKIDITIQDPRHNGLACVDLVKEYIRIYPALRPLSFVLKHFLTILDLNDTYSGGLSSYGLLLMIVHFFQTKEQPRSMLPIEEQDLGELLLSFLYFYGFEHDYYTHLAVYPKKVLRNGELDNEYINNGNLMAMIQQQQASILQPKIVIQDPISLKNNIGRSTFRIKEIKNAFMAAYFEAFKPCTCEVHGYIQKIDRTEDKEIECTSILRKMFLAYRPEQ